MMRIAVAAVVTISYSLFGNEVCKGMYVCIIYACRKIKAIVSWVSRHGKMMFEEEHVICVCVPTKREPEEVSSNK